MSDKNKNIYDDDNIPEVDLPQDNSDSKDVELLPESSHHKKDSSGRD